MDMAVAMPMGIANPTRDLGLTTQVFTGGLSQYIGAICRATVTT